MIFLTEPHLSRLARQKVTPAQWNSKIKSNEYRQRMMPFGKHKGKMLRDIPDSYITWAVDNLKGEIQGYLERELNFRKLKK